VTAQSRGIPPAYAEGLHPSSANGGYEGRSASDRREASGSQTAPKHPILLRLS